MYSSRIPRSTSDGFGLISTILRSSISGVKSIYYELRSELAKLGGNLHRHERFRLQQHYYHTLATGTIRSFAYFGDNLISPSINSPKSESIDDFYNDRQFHEKIKDDKGTLNGICRGLVLEFISLVLDKISEGNLDFLKIKQISEQFSEGGSKETSECHYQYAATKSRNYSRKLNLEIKEIEKDISNFSKKTTKINQIESDNYSDKTEPFEKISKLEESEVNESPSTAPPIDIKALIDTVKSLVQPEKWQADHFELAVDNSDKKLFLLTNEAEINEHTNDLKDGAYIVDMSSPSKDIGHVIAYIKYKNKRYLFDPNIGTVKIPENMDAQYLFYCLKNVDLTQLKFFPCTKKIEDEPLIQ